MNSSSAIENLGTEARASKINIDHRKLFKRSRDKELEKLKHRLELELAKSKKFKRTQGK